MSKQYTVKKYVGEKLLWTREVEANSAAEARKKAEKPEPKAPKTEEKPQKTISNNNSK